MTTPISLSSKQRKLLISALILLGLSYGLLLFFRGFFDPDEGRYAEIPREMAMTGQWKEMRLFGFRYYEKPPLAYWMVAPAIAVFGAKDWATRIPLLFNIAMIAGLFYLLTRHYWPGTLGRWALLCMLSMTGFMIGFCLLITDGFLVFWFSLTCTALFQGFQQKTRPRPQLLWLLLAALAAAAGFLTKGAIAAVLPAAILLIWLFWEGRLRDLLTLSLPLAGMVFMLALWPCMLMLERHNPGFIRHFIFEEHTARFLGTRAMQLHPEPIWYFVATLIPLLLPWTLFLGRAIRLFSTRRILKTDALSRFFTVWVLVVIVFFSLSSGKLMSYILPAIPPLGLLVGRWGLAEPADGSLRDRQYWKLGLSGPLLLALVVITTWLISYFQLIPLRVYSITGISVLALAPLIIGMPILGLTRGWAHFSGAIFASSVLLFSCALLLSPLAGRDFNVLLHINSSHVYKALAAKLKPEDQLVCFWKYRPALSFYAQRSAYLFQTRNELTYGMLMEPERPGYLDDSDDLQRLREQAPGRVYAIVEPKDYQKRFLPLQLNFVTTAIPTDPDTMILELLPQNPIAD